MIWFYFSCLFAFTAGHMVNYSVIIYAQEVFHSQLISGIGFGLCFGPPIVLGWVAGAILERKNPLTVIHAAQALFLSALALFQVVHQAPDPIQRLPVFLIAAFLVGIGWSFVSPARMASVSRIAKPENLKISSILFNLILMSGFGLGPILISVIRKKWEFTQVFQTAAGFFILSSLFLLGARARKSPQAPSSKSIIGEVLQGLSATRSDRGILTLMLSSLIGYCLMGPIQILLPKFAIQNLGMEEIQRGTFLGLMAPSLIVGGMLALPLSRTKDSRIFIAPSISAAGLAFAAISQMTQPQGAIFALVAVGLLGGLGISLIMANLQTRSPEAYRSRILSQYSIISQVLPAASGLSAGVGSHFYGVVPAILGAGLLIAVSQAFLAFRPR